MSWGPLIGSLSGAVAAGCALVSILQVSAQTKNQAKYEAKKKIEETIYKIRREFRLVRSPIRTSYRRPDSFKNDLAGSANAMKEYVALLSKRVEPLNDLFAMLSEDVLSLYAITKNDKLFDCEMEIECFRLEYWIAVTKFVNGFDSEKPFDEIEFKKNEKVVFSPLGLEDDKFHDELDKSIRQIISTIEKS